MSYDLYLKPRSGVFARPQFTDYFGDRTDYKVEGNQAWYQNGDTGTYFVFEYSDNTVSNAPDREGSPRYQLSFNINYYRPSYFGKEAEPEVRAFISRFDLLVDDPQIDGMGVGEYVREKFLDGWAKGNEVGYRCMLNQQEQVRPHTLPTAEIERIWSWNHTRRARQAEVGESQFVPRIFYFEMDGGVKSAVVWPDGIPCVLPQTDYVFVPRQELAPKRLFRRSPDTVIVRWSEVERIIHRHGSTVGGGFVLNYSVPPDDIAAWVRDLALRSPQVNGIGADSVLDAELVARSLARG